MSRRKPALGFFRDREGRIRPLTRANLPRPPGAKFDLKAEPMTPRERELLEAEKQKRLAEIEARKQQAMIQNQAAAQQKPGVKP